jgi:nucleoside-diphosphate-sugar epimerase
MNAMDKLRVAVTGGSGRIGRAVVKQLLAQGHQVVNLDRQQAPEPLARMVYVDLTKREQVQPVLEQVDAVCHLGEIPGPGRQAPDHVYAHNTQTGAAVLQSAADLKLKRVIYTSSCQVYGYFGGPVVPPVRVPMDETHPLLPQNTYGLAKVANEGYARIVAEQNGLSVAIFRFPAVWDWLPEQPDDHHWNWLERATGPVDEFGCYLHSDDAARAYVLALENPRPGCEAYHFTAKEVVSGAPLPERWKKHHPDYPQFPADWPPFKSPLLLDKAKAHFGWEPRFNLLDLYRKRFGHDPNFPVAEPKPGESKRRRGYWY